MIYNNNCQNCIHFLAWRSCVAFEEIPQDVWSGKVSHTAKIKGDRGIIFEPIDKEKGVNGNVIPTRS